MRVPVLNVSTGMRNTPDSSPLLSVVKLLPNTIADVSLQWSLTSCPSKKGYTRVFGFNPLAVKLIEALRIYCSGWSVGLCMSGVVNSMLNLI
jgi:hypothetical protein